MQDLGPTLSQVLPPPTCALKGIVSPSLILYSLPLAFCPFFHQGIFPTQGSSLGLLHCKQILYCLSHQGAQGDDTKQDSQVLRPLGTDAPEPPGKPVLRIKQL